MKTGLMVAVYLIGALVALGDVFSQSPVSSTAPPPPETTVNSDTAIVFHSPHPLIEHSSSDPSSGRANSWGFGGSITDYGFGVGLYYRYNLSNDVSIGANFDIGGAKGHKEYGFGNEIKINRIFVMPLVANVQYRLFGSTLSESFRPYLTAGAGPTFIMTNDGQEEYFSALLSPEFATTLGGFVGVGANFGLDPTTTFGVSLRYFIIPYSKGVESTLGDFLHDFNGVSLTVSYGFNW